MSDYDGNTISLEPPIECGICTRPLAPSEVDEHIRSHGYEA